MSTVKEKVVELVNQGKTEEEIAQELGMSLSDAKMYIMHANVILGIYGRS